MDNMRIRKNGQKIVDCHCSSESAMVQLQPLTYQCNKCHWIVRLCFDSAPEEWWQGRFEPSLLYPFCENCQAEMNYENFGYWDEDNRYFKAFTFSCSRHTNERRINLYVEEVSAQEWNDVSGKARRALMDKLVENSLLQKFLDDGTNSDHNSFAFENRIVSIEYANAISAEDRLFWEYLKNNGIIFNLSLQQASVSFSFAKEFLERYKTSKSLMATRVEV